MKMLVDLEAARPGSAFLFPGDCAGFIDPVRLAAGPPATSAKWFLWSCHLPVPLDKKYQLDLATYDRYWTGAEGSTPKQ